MASLDAIARCYTTLVQGLSVQVRDGASRADLEAVLTCAMAAGTRSRPGTTENAMLRLESSSLRLR